MNKDLIESYLKEIFGFLMVKPDFAIETMGEDGFSVKIEGDDLSFLIGKFGKTLEALQNMLGLMIFKKLGVWLKISIDINGYKDARSEKLHEITKHYIDKVRFFKDAVQMPPMSSWERRLVHMFVAEYADISSESEGTGKDRRVVLKIKE